MRLRWRWRARGWRRLRRGARIEQQRQQQQGFGQDRFQHHNAKYDTPDLCFPVSSTAKIAARSEEHTSELQSLMRISYAGLCLKKTKYKHTPLHIDGAQSKTPHY